MRSSFKYQGQRSWLAVSPGLLVFFVVAIFAYAYFESWLVFFYGFILWFTSVYYLGGIDEKNPIYCEIQLFDDKATFYGELYSYSKIDSVEMGRDIRDKESLLISVGGETYYENINGFKPCERLEIFNCLNDYIGKYRQENANKKRQSDA